MTARKKTTKPETRPVTVADLILALATWPLDAELQTGESGGGGYIATEIEGEFFEIWEGDSTPPQHRPNEIVKVVRRSEPLDDFAAAKEFLEWLRAQHYGMPQVATGGGHNEPTSYRDLSPAELAEEFARRES